MHTYFDSFGLKPSFAPSKRLSTPQHRRRKKPKFLVRLAHHSCLEDHNKERSSRGTDIRRQIPERTQNAKP
ncbi:hypothetical protein EUTSA_v10000728mg [Eutrema salsugineum]|uniref:Uncharacterized protein n=1 Tax=Eutrema salsugineum TaxID=72664 RepID=V4LRZ9_EUTSA|nr:hypothetical protein EUTSA_v10000728mg [Eutrema salsugineum]